MTSGEAEKITAKMESIWKEVKGSLPIPNMIYIGAIGLFLRNSDRTVSEDGKRFARATDEQRASIEAWWASVNE